MDSDLTNNLNIVLVGMPGAGKSFIGCKLAKLLAHFDYIDTDETIEEQMDLTVSEIFEQHGESHFRELESQIIKSLSKNRNQIISIGGGAFENPENISSLKENGITFYLKASPYELFNRIQNQTHRPLLKNGFSQDSIKNLFKKREKSYMKADFVIDTDKKQAYTILDDILRKYENYVKCN